MIDRKQRALTLLGPKEFPIELHTITQDGPRPFPAILGKGPWLELGKNMRHFENFSEV